MIDEIRLTALHDAGEYRQSLELINAWGLPGLLKEQLNAPGYSGLALVVANVYRDLAQYAQAEEYYLQALAALARTAATNPRYAAGLVELGALYHLQGRYDEARRLFEQACAAHRAAVEPDLVSHSRSLQALAGLHDTLNDRRQAKACLAQARALIEQAGAPSLVMAELLLEECWVLCRMENVHVSVSRARQALAVYREKNNDLHPGMLQARYRLGRLLLPLWELDEAAELLEELPAIRVRMLGEEHPLHAAAVESLALLRLAQGNSREAEQLARRALALTIAGLGDRHLDVAARQKTLARILQTGNQLTAAAECLEQALAIVREVVGDGHVQTARIQLELADVQQAMGQHSEALRLMREALDLLDHYPDDVSYEQATVCQSLAQLRAEAGAVDEAVTLARRAACLGEELGADPLIYGQALLLQARIKTQQRELAETSQLIDCAEQALAGLPPLHPLRIQAVATRAGLAHLAGDPRLAVQLARALATCAEQSYGEGSLWLPPMLDFLAEQLHLAGDLVECEKIYERMLDIQRRRCGPEHPDLAIPLRGLAHLHLSRGNAAAAEVRFRQILDIRRSCLGDKHPDTAQSFNDLACWLYQAGYLIPADSLFRKALQIRRDCLGSTHSDTLASQQGLAQVALARGASAEAADLLEQGLALIGTDHPQKLQLEHSLALVYQAQGNPARAETLLRAILVARERILGELHIELLPVLADLARVLVGLGDYLAARELLQRILSIHSQSPFHDPLGQAADLVNISDLHRRLNDPERAVDLAQQALEMARRYLKASDPGLVGYLTHFARACQAQSCFSAASRHFREALGIVRKAGGDRHPLVAGLFIDLAGLEASRGNPSRATVLYVRAAQLLETVLGEDHPDHAAALRALGLHLQSIGEQSRAEETLRRYLRIVIRTYGPHHPAVASAYLTLSEQQRQRGNLAEATKCCQEALDLIRCAETPLDGFHAQLLHALAVLCRQQGLLDEAAKLLGQALEIDRTSIGEESMGHLESLQELAQIEAARGEHARASQRLQRVLLSQNQLTAAFVYLPSGPFRDRLLTRPWRLVQALLTLAPRLPEVAEPALESLLRWKGISPADLVPGNRAALTHRYPEQAMELDRLFDLSAQMAGRLIQGSGPEGMETHHDLLCRWEQEREKLEEQLADAVPELARLRSLRAVDLSVLQRTLPADATFLEFVRFQPVDFEEVCAGRDGLLPPRYLSFVLRPGEKRVILCDLGLATDLENHGRTVALQTMLAPHTSGASQLLVATDGHLGPADCAQLGGPRRKVHVAASGRLIASALLAQSAEPVCLIAGNPIFVGGKHDIL
jgi:tetratricopeptide (TPR) repeat protein